MQASGDVETCRNCDAGLSGDYCAACGQPRFGPADRSLRVLLADAVDALTDFDSRLWRSLGATLLSPGRIARDWMEGRRGRWMSPLRIFLVANLVFFLAPTLTDLSLPLRDQMRGSLYRQLAVERCAAADARLGVADACRGGQIHSSLTERWLLQRLQAARQDAAERGLEFRFDEFEARYDAQTAEIGKLLVILHAPFVALALLLAARRARRYFVEHLVVALGMLSFILLLLPVLLWPLSGLAALLPTSGHRWLVTTVPFLLLGLVVGHFVSTCRRCYDRGWWGASAQGVAAFAAFAVANLLVIRAVHFLLTLWTM